MCIAPCFPRDPNIWFGLAKQYYVVDDGCDFLDDTNRQTKNGATQTMTWIWDFLQQRDINALQQRSLSDGQYVRESTARSEQLSDRYEHLALVCQALWEILQKKTGATEDMLLSKMEEIDLRDGTLDGRVRDSVRCAKCNRPVSRRRTKCFVCGEPLPPGVSF